MNFTDKINKKNLKDVQVRIFFFYPGPCLN